MSAGKTSLRARVRRKKTAVRSATSVHDQGQAAGKAPGSGAAPYETLHEVVGIVDGLPPGLSESTGNKFRARLLASRGTRQRAR